MKAQIEYDLPSEQDAFDDANNGSKWKELVRDLQEMLLVKARTDESKERREAYELIRQHLLSERALAGLGLVSNATLEEGRIKHSEYWHGEMNLHLAKAGYGKFATDKEGKEHANDVSGSAKGNSSSKESRNHNAQQNNGRQDNAADGG